MEYISDNIVNSIIELAEEYPELIYCGSLGLVLNGKLKRNVNDIDVITTTYNHTEFIFKSSGSELSPSMKHSDVFYVGDIFVKNILFMTKYGIKVDLFSMGEKHVVNYNTIDFNGIKINVENPESAIDIKKKYIISNPAHSGVWKHLKDLLLLGISRQEIIEIIESINVNQKKINVDYDDTLPF